MLPVTAQRISLVGVCLGLMLLHWLWVVKPIHRWIVVHAVYSSNDIHEHDITIKQLIRPHTAVFSNGERHDYGAGADVLAAVMWLVGALVIGGLLELVGRRLFPAALSRQTPGTNAG